MKKKKNDSTMSLDISFWEREEVIGVVGGNSIRFVRKKYTCDYTILLECDYTILLEWFNDCGWKGFKKFWFVMVIISVI